MRRPLLSRLTMLAACMAVAAHAQQPQPPAVQPATPLDWSGDDGRRVAELEAKGERREAKWAVLFTPAGAIDDAEEAALVARLDKGIAELRAMIGRHSWQAVKEDRITYYVHGDRFVSHASGRGAVFVSLARVQDGRAPLLHEAAHEWLSPIEDAAGDSARIDRIWREHPLWLTEGLAEYMGLTAAARAGVKEGDVFAIGGLSGAGPACRERLTGPRGPEILPYIGGRGAPAALMTTERPAVAPTFYACATSFTSFIVGKIGLAETVALMSRIFTESVLAQIERLAGTSMDALRAEWRTAIGAQ
jgi:hypothetical protein